MRLFSKDIMLYSSPKGWSVARKTDLIPSMGNVSIAYGNKEFVRLKNNNIKQPIAEQSTDINNWEIVTSYQSSGDAIKIIYDGTKFVTFIKDSSDTKMCIVRYSTNLDSWDWNYLPEIYNYKWIDFIYNGVNWVALSEDGYVSVSNNAMRGSWSTPIQLASEPIGPDKWLHLIFDNEKIIAIGQDRWASVSIDNGNTWTPYRNNITSDFDTVIYANKFIAIAGSNVFESTDGNTWVDLGENINLNLPMAKDKWAAMTKNDNVIVALSDYGYISTKRI